MSCGSGVLASPSFFDDGQAEISANPRCCPVAPEGLFFGQAFSGGIVHRIIRSAWGFSVKGLIRRFMNILYNKIKVLSRIQ